MLIETHAHLDYSDFDADRDAVVQRAKEAGVERIITIGTNVESSQRAIKLAEQYSEVFAVIGVHPTEVETVQGNWIEQLSQMADHPKVVAIGEMGLDYHHLPSGKMENPFRNVLAMEVAQDPLAISRKIADDDYKNLQATVFRAQLDLALEKKLNVVIHQRDAWEDTLNILMSYSGKLRGVFHCFGGSVEQALSILSMGHLVSFTGIVTFKNAENVRQVIAAIPQDCFMVETDCPYLAPVPYRGKRCEPAHVQKVAEKIAEVRGMSLSEVEQCTTETAKHFFRFSQ
ncbi:MAG: TatD family hydrolase [Verrucomicrobiae bacterium]|nr:TatD family hydrolase [Verrucomicrobiae bacterium]